LLARAKPDAPDIEFANFLWELKEFPSLLKHAGDLWASRRAIPSSFRNGVRMNRDLRAGIAETPITVAFGWIPLLSDLRNLIGVAEAVDKRLQRLRDASKIGGTTTRIRLRQGSVASHSAQTHGAFSFFVERITDFEEWGVLKHTTRSSGRIPTWSFEDARSLAFSTSLSPTAIWNSIPWSWLIDYLINVGSFLEAANHRIGWKAEQAIIMRKYTTYCELTPTGSYPDGTESGQVIFQSLNRNVVTNPTPAMAFTPMLSLNQLANLGALCLAFGLGKPMTRLTK
jgi:hypothetical protein